MRCFLAIDLDKKIKEKLSDIQNKLRGYCEKARWVHKENFHITLKFIGEIDKKKIIEIQNNCGYWIKSIDSFQLCLDRLGWFGNKNSMRVLWIGVNGNLGKLYTLYNYLEEGLAQIGFEKNTSAYLPHITLARSIQLKNSENLIQYNFEKNFNIKDYNINVDKISLFKSEQIGRHRIYTPVYEFHLQKRE